MNKRLSLKLSVSLAVLMIGIIIVLTYSAISRHFYILGMDNIVSANMEQAAKSYITTIPDTEREHSNSFSGYDISHQWQQQPANIQQLFTEPQDENQLNKIVDAPLFSRPDIIYFLIKLTINGEPLYISRMATAANASKLIGQNIHKSKQLLFVISSGVIVSLGLIIWLILRRVSQPVSQLVEWTHSLNSKTLNDTPPNFHYPELNEMAALIRTSLSSSQQSLEREERFLGYASHELRTPISVIRNNIELLAKLKKTTTDVSNPKFDQIIERIDRASLTMKQLSETLLWLSRDHHDDLSSKALSLNLIVEELAEESQFLLKGKSINLSITTQENSVIEQPEHPVRIVVGNLIRNAFQHTQQGDITISQHDNQLYISNQYQPLNKSGIADDLGFGLGLQLTEQLTEKLGWHYQTIANETEYQVTITF